MTKILFVLFLLFLCASCYHIDIKYKMESSINIEEIQNRGQEVENINTHDRKGEDGDIHNSQEVENVNTHNHKGEDGDIHSGEVENIHNQNQEVEDIIYMNGHPHQHEVIIVPDNHNKVKNIDDVVDTAFTIVPCPDGMPIPMCLTNPCDNVTCPDFPEAVCKPYLCGGCNYVFLDPITIKRVDCYHCPNTSKDGKCLTDINSTHQCNNTLMCNIHSCTKHLNAQCCINHCEKCELNYYDVKGNRIPEDECN